jgi:RNA polymerase sigma-70 factor (ECF subfamily)
MTAPIRDDGAPHRSAGPPEQAWNLLYRTNAEPLYRYLLRLTRGDRGSAEDHLQETFLRAWRSLQDKSLDLTTIRPWLFTVARRIVIDAVRSRQARPTEVIGDDLTVVGGTYNDIERFIQAHTVRGALRALSLKHRSALVELFYHERTPQEAADILGIPAGTIKSRAHYALRALRAATVAAEAPGGCRPTWPGRHRDEPRTDAPGERAGNGMVCPGGAA